MPSKPDKCAAAVAKWRRAIALAANASVNLANRKRHPHVVMIMADDLGFSAYGLWGHTLEASSSPLSRLAAPSAQMPALTRLAREGTRFTHAYQAGPWCSPSRTALMTGRAPARVVAGGQQGGEDVPFTVPTVTGMLARAGYATAHLGKWSG